MKWHAKLREKCIRTGANEPVMMINGNDTSLLKDLMLMRVYCLLLFTEKRLKNIFHLVKVLHIIHGFLNQEQDRRNVNALERSQPRLAIIFCGQGKQISDDEKMAWHPDVDVFSNKMNG